METICQSEMRIDDRTPVREQKRERGTDREKIDRNERVATLSGAG